MLCELSGSNVSAVVTRHALLTLKVFYRIALFRVLKDLNFIELRLQFKRDSLIFAVDGSKDCIFIDIGRG